ncbi:insulinase family protein [Candidatus Saccharibacteria bacterium]|jgi:predicted Zn-dependent peptidase|nr:insulinase family protein [Candidatus Saccharibacteria bacterium]
MMEHSLKEIRLKNGARGILVDVADAPVMTMNFSFRAGYSTADVERWEVPHVLEHVILGANNNFGSAREFSAELEKNGAYSNGTTDFANVTYLAECADFEWQRVLELMLGAITMPKFLPKEIIAEKANVSEEISGNINNYFRVLGTHLAQAMGMNVLPDEQRMKQIDSIKASDIIEHYQRTHVKENLRFIIAGNVLSREKTVVTLLEKAFDKLPSGKRFSLPKQQAKALDEPLVLERSGVEKLHFFIDLYASDRDTREQVAASVVLNTMLTGTMDSILFGEARERGLVYSMGSGSSRGKNWSSWWLGGNVTDGNANALLKLTAKILHKVLDNDFDEARVQQAIMREVGQFQRSNQRVAEVASTYGGRYLFDGTIIDIDEQLDNIRAVTAADVVAYAKRMVDERRYGVGVLGRSAVEHAPAIFESFQVIMDLEKTHDATDEHATPKKK